MSLKKRLWIKPFKASCSMEILEYVKKFDTVSLYWHNLNFSFIIIFLRSLHSTYTAWNFLFNADYQSQTITYAHPQINHIKKVYVNPLTVNPRKWSNTLKQFVGKLPTNCLSVFDYFVGLALKGLNYIGSLQFNSNIFLSYNEYIKYYNMLYSSL